MKWFKHYATSYLHNEIVVRIESRHGIIGYGRYYKLLEMVVSGIETATEGASLRIEEANLCQALKCRPKVLYEFLDSLAEFGGVEVIKYGEKTSGKRLANRRLTTSQSLASHRLVTSQSSSSIPMVQLNFPDLLKLLDKNATASHARGRSGAPRVEKKRASATDISLDSLTEGSKRPECPDDIESW